MKVVFVGFHIFHPLTPASGGQVIRLIFFSKRSPFQETPLRMRKNIPTNNSQYGNFLLPLTKDEGLRVIAKKVLREFWTKHSDCEQQLKSWYQEAEKSEWKNTHEIKKEYPTASILGDNRVIFNIKGNNYRLIVKINFHYQMMWIRFVGTHKEYDRIDANKI
jgi:mRNA interferase HigB